MKRSIIFITTVLSIFLLIGCVSAGFFDFLGDFDTLDENPDDMFVVGFNSQFPPFGYQEDDGNYTGFDLELAQEVAKRNNWTFKPQPIIDWNTKQMELESNEVDCIWSEFTINGRENDYAWSEPYYNNTQVVVVKADSNINSTDDLKGKILEVQQGSSVLKTIDDNKTLKNAFKEINQVDGYDTAFMDLKTGVCDVVVLDNGSAYYLLNKYDDIRILDKPLSSEQYGVGFKKGNEDLRNQVQKTLNEMFKDGTVEKIAQNYSDFKISESLIYPK